VFAPSSPRETLDLRSRRLSTQSPKCVHVPDFSRMGKVHGSTMASMLNYDGHLYLSYSAAKVADNEYSWQ